jgi:hypothetical protein
MGNWILSEPCEHCGSRHRTWIAAAKCRWRKGLIWVSGDPPPGGPCYALVSFCRVGHRLNYRIGATTVTLWPTLAEAQQSKMMIDRTGCGGGCCRRHYIYRGEPSIAAA